MSFSMSTLLQATHTLFHSWWNTSDGIELECLIRCWVLLFLKLHSRFRVNSHQSKRKMECERECIVRGACVIVLFGSLPLGERVSVRISGINWVLSLKLHFGQNMQAARHLKPASGKAYSKAFYRNIQNGPSRGLKQEAGENSSFLNDNK